MRTTSLARRLAIAALLAVIPVGCAQKIEPEIASPANEPTYATDFPAELQRTMDGINDAESKSKELNGKLTSQMDGLKSPPWARVIEIVDLADAEGRAYAYVEARREHDGAQVFFDAEKEEITKKVAGAAQAAAKAKQCDADVSGSVAYAFKDIVEKRLEKRLHDRSEAHLYIDRNAAALGKDNVGKLSDAADQIASASYQAHVVVVEEKLKLRRMIDEAESVKKTLEATTRAEQVYQADSSRTAAEKKASQEREEAARKAAGSIDAALTQAKGVAERSEERVAAITKSYDDNIAALRADLKKRAGQ